MTDTGSAAPPATSPAPDFLPTKVVQEWEYKSPLIACRIDPSGQYVVSAAHDQLLQRWEITTGKMTPLKGHDSWVRAIGFSHDHQTLYTGGYEGRLCWWSLHEEAPQPLRQLDAHIGWIRALSISHDGQWLATAGNDLTVKIWNTKNGELVRTLTGHKSHVYSVYFPPLDNVLISGDLLGVVHQWEPATGKLVRTFDASDLHSFNEGQGAHYGGVRTLSLSRDGSQLACGGLHKATNPFGAVQEPLVLVFDWSTGNRVIAQLSDGITQGIIWRIVHHPSGPLCGASGGGSGGFLLCWKAGEEKPCHKFQLPSTALDMDLHPDGKRFVTAHHDRKLRVAGIA